MATDYIGLLKQHPPEEWKRIRAAERNAVLERLDTGDVYDVRGYYANLGEKTAYLLRTSAKGIYGEFDRHGGNRLVVIGNNSLTMMQGTSVRKLYQRIIRHRLKGRRL